MTELQILRTVSNSNGIGFTDLLNSGKTKSRWRPQADKQQIDDLVHDGYLTGTSRGENIITITDKGEKRLQLLEDELEQLEKQAAKAAKEKRVQMRHDWAIAIFSTLGGALLSGPLWNGIFNLIDFLKPFFS